MISVTSRTRMPGNPEIFILPFMQWPQLLLRRSRSSLDVALDVEPVTEPGAVASLK